MSYPTCVRWKHVPGPCRERVCKPPRMPFLLAGQKTGSWALRASLSNRGAEQIGCREMGHLLPTLDLSLPAHPWDTGQTTVPAAGTTPLLTGGNLNTASSHCAGGGHPILHKHLSQLWVPPSSYSHSTQFGAILCIATYYSRKKESFSYILTSLSHCQ